MLSKTLNVARTEGFVGLLARAKRRLYLRTYVYQCALCPDDEPLTTAYGLRALPLTAELVATMEREHPTELTDEKKRELLGTLAPDSTDRVYVTVDASGAILNYSCIAYGDNYDPWLRYRVRATPKNAYIFDCYTFTPHRNKGAQKFSLLALSAVAQRNNCTTATCLIDDGNLFSEQAFRSVGFTRVSCIEHYNLRLFRLNRQRAL